MDLHHLRVVDYERKSVAKENTPDPNKYKIIDKILHTNESNNITNVHPIRIQNKMQHPEAASKKHNKSPGKVSTSKMNQVKDADQRKFKEPLVRTLSVTDIGKRLKKCDSICIKQRIKNRLKAHRSKKCIRKKCRKSQDDIKVLYTSQMFGEQDSNHHNIPVANVSNTHSATRLTNNVGMYYQAYAGAISKKLSKTNMNRKIKELKSESDVLISVHSDANHVSRDKMCFSLTEYSKCKTCEARAKEKNSLRSEFIKEVAMGKSESLLPYERDYSEFKGTCKDASTNTSNIIKQPTSSIMKQPTSKQLLVKVDKKCGCRPGRTMVDEKTQGNAIVANFFRMLLVLLKYILLALTVIAWSPCIIISLLCWFVIAPLTPDEVRADEMVPACIKCGNSFFSRLVECVTRKYMQIAATFDAVKRSFCVGHVKLQVTPSPKCYASKVIPKRHLVGVDSQPNTDKKYVLFHSQERGWLMKPMRGQHKLNLPNQISVYPAMCGKGYRNKKSVSFWDSEASYAYNQTTIKKIKCSSSCVCAHKYEPTATSPDLPLVICECFSKTPKKPPTHAKCECPVRKTSKSANTPVDSINSHHSLGPFSSPQQQPLKRKIYGACSHHRPAPQRPKISQSDPEISETPRKPEERMRRRSSSVPHSHSKHHEEKRTQCEKRTSLHRERRTEGKDEKVCHQGEKQPQTLKPKPTQGTCLRPWSRNKERLKPQKGLKRTCSVGVQMDKPLCGGQKTLHGRIRRSEPSKAEKYFQRMKSDWDFSCKDLYLTTLKKKPCFWVYKSFPNMYPFCLTTCRMFENCCTVVLFICSACVWCPIFLCCYSCYYMICDCMCSC